VRLYALRKGVLVLSRGQAGREAGLFVYRSSAQTSENAFRGSVLWNGAWRTSLVRCDGLVTELALDRMHAWCSYVCHCGLYLTRWVSLAEEEREAVAGWCFGRGFRVDGIHSRTGKL
jgi:hypothetical protein